jgi:hypothetical protein
MLPEYHAVARFLAEGSVQGAQTPLRPRILRR